MIEAPSDTPSSRNATLTTPTSSDAVAATITVPKTVLAASGLCSATAGAMMSFGAAVLFATVTPTLAVVEWPAASRATAVSVCAPFTADSVVHITSYGATASSAPSGTPSSLNCTPKTSRSSDAVALTVTAPLTVAPVPGLVNATVGADVSFDTVTLTMLAVVYASKDN